ncbi:response regulator [Paenibacillus sp. NEAU-GSW1]|nr:response regulator [Paenibacillus sp. NEAU-GSW1]
MYRMLIVDDEEIITDGLMDIFSSLDLNLDLYKAYSGQEALSLLNRTRVDIVLSDICMPGIDGLELMGNIRQSWPQCKIIFLTGHNDFDYVYQAIQAPGVQYVLKNEGYPKLIEAVKRALKDIEEAMHVKDLIRQSREKLNILETLAQGDYFRFLFQNGKMQDLEEDFERLHIPLNPFLPVLLVLGNLTYFNQSSHSYSDRQESALAVKFLAETFLAERTVSMGMIDRYGDMIWLIQPDQPSEEGGWDYEQTVMFLEGTFELIQQACLDSLDVTMAVTLCSQAITWESLPVSYDKMRRQQHFRVGDGNLMVQKVQLNEAAAYSSVSSARDRSLHTKSEALAIHLEAGRREEFLRLFDELTVQAAVEERNGEAYLTELYYALSLPIISYINRWEMQDKVGIFSLLQSKVYRSWAESFILLRDSAELLFSARRSGERNRAAHVIQKICSYIEEHIAEDLSLVRLADVISFNPSYLSRLFKQEQGVNLSEYIEETRIRKAKELLGMEEIKVAEVGARIGYESPQSFTRLFKKLTGITPQEYRMSFENSHGA